MQSIRELIDILREVDRQDIAGLIAVAFFVLAMTNLSSIAAAIVIAKRCAS